MISFKRDGTVVKSDVTTFIPNFDDRVFHFQWECATEAYAGLLSAHMQRDMGAKLKAIRVHAYEEGWKDAKAKRAREEWFRSSW